MPIGGVEKLGTSNDRIQHFMAVVEEVRTGSCKGFTTDNIPMGYGIYTADRPYTNVIHLGQDGLRRTKQSPVRPASCGLSTPKENKKSDKLCRVQSGWVSIVVGFKLGSKWEHSHFLFASFSFPTSICNSSRPDVYKSSTKNINIFRGIYCCAHHPTERDRQNPTGPERSLKPRLMYITTTQLC